MAHRHLPFDIACARSGLSHSQLGGGGPRERPPRLEEESAARVTCGLYGPQEIKVEMKDDAEASPMDTEEEAEMVPAEVRAPYLTGLAGQGRARCSMPAERRHADETGDGMVHRWTPRC